MAEFPHVIPATDLDPAQAEAATRAVLWRIDHKNADPADIRWALETLGLIQPAPAAKTVKERPPRAQDPITKRWLPNDEETA